jgi:hypothetical protein
MVSKYYTWAWSLSTVPGMVEHSELGIGNKAEENVVIINSSNNILFSISSVFLSKKRYVRFVLPVVGLVCQAGTVVLQAPVLLRYVNSSVLSNGIISRQCHKIESAYCLAIL